MALSIRWWVCLTRPKRPSHFSPQFDERGPSPEPAFVVTSSQEVLGPDEEEDAEFAKELAKLVTDTSAESRKVDRRTAQTLWESAVLPPGMRKRHEEGDSSLGSGNPGMMNFTMLTKRGNKQQVRQLAIPSESALAVQTRSAQEQDKVEQQHLKRLVLDYEQREEAEEIKGGLAFTFFICQTGTLGQPSKRSPDLSRFASPDSPYTCLKDAIS